MKFEDAKLPQDYIEVKLREETHGSLIEIEIQGDGAEVIYLTKEKARAMGELLINLSSETGLEGIVPTEEQKIEAARMFRCDFDKRSDEEKMWLKNIAVNWLICWQKTLNNKKERGGD